MLFSKVSFNTFYTFVALYPAILQLVHADDDDAPRQFSAAEIDFGDKKTSLNQRSPFGFIRQYYDGCSAGYDECATDSDYCCPVGKECCPTGPGCFAPGGVCCGLSGSCKPGATCCGDGCAPVEAQCCPDGGYCDPGYYCKTVDGVGKCGKSSGGSAPTYTLITIPTYTSDPTTITKSYYNYYTYTVSQYYYTYWYTTVFTTTTLTSQRRTTRETVTVTATDSADADSMFSDFTVTMSLIPEFLTEKPTLTLPTSTSTTSATSSTSFPTGAAANGGNPSPSPGAAGLVRAPGSGSWLNNWMVLIALVPGVLMFL